MAAYAAFLGGMNLGRRRITNSELTVAFESLGLTGASTFRASGNVVFEAGDRAEEELAGAIERGLREALGYEVPTFLRGGDELRSIAAAEPFGRDRVAASSGKLQVMLLQRRPTAKRRDALLALATAADPLAVVGRELYWLPSGRTVDSELDLGIVKGLTGPLTQRTLGTIEGVAAKLGG